MAPLKPTLINNALSASPTTTPTNVAALTKPPSPRTTDAAATYSPTVMHVYFPITCKQVPGGPDAQADY
jgi:hypothetical protein